MYLIGDAASKSASTRRNARHARAKIAAWHAAYSVSRSGAELERRPTRQGSRGGNALDRDPRDGPSGATAAAGLLDVPWYRSLWSGFRDLFSRRRAAAGPHLEAGPGARHLGQYGRQKKSWVMSLALQSAVVVAVFSRGNIEDRSGRRSRASYYRASDDGAWLPYEPQARLRTHGGRRWRRRPLAATRIAGPGTEGSHCGSSRLPRRVVANAIRSSR